MGVALEIISIIIGLGLPVTYMAWGHLSPLAVKFAGASLITFTTGYAAFLASAFVYGFGSELRRQRRE